MKPKSCPPKSLSLPLSLGSAGPREARRRPTRRGGGPGAQAGRGWGRGRGQGRPGAARAAARRRPGPRPGAASGDRRMRWGSCLCFRFNIRFKLKSLDIHSCSIYEFLLIVWMENSFDRVIGNRFMVWIWNLPFHCHDLQEKLLIFFGNTIFLPWS